ncbi:Fe-S cluster assembly protein SufD [Gleimia hominis]|uniref:Fe-S cluster assembly protein SufD n=1 Tax=Gleimia hominis TaxID=595468 RepID=A0ABU3ICG6_9ACTO|nr:Fe-S cluster assembly protein SufD [Gleimia hominis]MDT3768070.1 Fe-S cluster assembly protein SufD [Gleimia hominis]
MTIADTMARKHSHGEGTQHTYSSRADRPTSFDPADIPVPTRHAEDWRFTPLRRIDALFEPKDYSAVNCPVDVTLAGNATFEVVGMDDDRVAPVLAPGDRTGVVSWAAARETNLIEIPADSKIDEPIMVSTAGTDGLQSQRIYVRAHTGSEAVVVLSHSGSGKLNQTVEVDAQDGAKLTVVTLQEWDRDAIHASNHRLRAGKETELRHIVISFGGDMVRICTDTEFAAPRGRIELYGLYYVDEGQHLEHRPYIAHTQPDCYSRVTYKGALQGEDAHSVWVGDCLIGEDADGTDTYELNRNLVLTQGPKADSVPNLEIENGEIEGAGHASATGRFDDEQLFYLMSRGVPEMEARRLVVRGFFAELINEIGVPAIQDHLMESVEEELQRGGSLVFDK